MNCKFFIAIVVLLALYDIIMDIVWKINLLISMNETLIELCEAQLVMPEFFMHE